MNGSMQEEITTIFVVGFPDDMQEREFQNMFTFSSGFEAATLKVPALGELDDGMGGQGRKQIIGFAKFRTRMEALEARDVLSGRKVDAERGCVLKAEMAKKNLHTKRGLSNDHPIMNGSFSLNHFGPIPRRNSTKDGGIFAADPFYMGTSPSVSRDLFGAPDFPSPFEVPYDVESLLSRSSPGTFESPIAGSYSDYIDARPTLSAGLVTGRPTVLDPQSYESRPFPELLDNTPPGPPHLMARAHSFSERSFERGFSSALFNSDSLLTRIGSISLNGSTGSMGSSSPVTISDPSNGSSHGGSTFGNGNGINPAPPLTPGSVPSNDSNGSNGITTNSVSSSPFAPGTPNGSPFNSLRGNQDQNPPCNTLYVGNLPPDASEDELRQLFNRCPGYRRLCFRPRPNGPMCFVEFDDVQCATQALLQLYGNPLSNSTKGGIRLSYSKNPLGVRQQQPPLFPGSHHSMPVMIQ
ncbi:hypothetical protein HK097_001098 [Rhizophlyctis rosea]|uniref:RRM domain-containing protein n=1 Tax=Rhizophlyctis rosea TaxID=64517 RepID=A0AAD5SH15_9FUNG|nr:hypothetical protein HK097_001098 [Rhizophlyctis rosea]